MCTCTKEAAYLKANKSWDRLVLFCLKWKCNPEHSRWNTEPYLGMVQLRLGMTEAPCASPSVGAERGERGHPKTRETWTGFGPLQVCYVSWNHTFGSDKLRWAVLPKQTPVSGLRVFDFYNDVWRFFFLPGFNVQARDKSKRVVKNSNKWICW